MADLLLIGADAALLEGIAQGLASAGHHVLTATSLAEGAFVTASAPPLLAVIDRVLLAHADARNIRLAPGGSLVVFGDPMTPLRAPVRRLVLAELQLPLERIRLSALATHVEARAKRAGRDLAEQSELDLDVRR